MVRLETVLIQILLNVIQIIYIPVWLDQKLLNVFLINIEVFNLHSSMVRLETELLTYKPQVCLKFTFQYGQIRNWHKKLLKIDIPIIYIPVWLDQKPIYDITMRIVFYDLHSSMVRLETYGDRPSLSPKLKFTFQYGQIRNSSSFLTDTGFVDIYIPVWLDQKLVHIVSLHLSMFHLHSSMVRLETIDEVYDINNIPAFTFQYGQIRNQYLKIENQAHYSHLHSSMVRLETKTDRAHYHVILLFTFQYGQIRNQQYKEE